LKSNDVTQASVGLPSPNPRHLKRNCYRQDDPQNDSDSNSKHNSDSAGKMSWEEEIRFNEKIFNVGMAGGVIEIPKPLAKRHPPQLQFQGYTLIVPYCVPF
jgi:hypothetical protein